MLFRVETFFNLRTTFESAFGVKVLSSKNSIPCWITLSSEIWPISVAFTFKIAADPVVDAIDVTTGSSFKSFPELTTLTEWIPPFSKVELVE